MRKLLLLCACLSLPLSACATVPSLAPATYSNTTTADEQTVTVFEQAYKAWRLAVMLGVNSGYIKGPLAGKVAGADNALYSYLVIIEKAYAAANASDLKTAIAHFNEALKDANALIGAK